MPSIEGVDTQSGLKRVLGNAALYLDLLVRYRDGQRDAAARIRSALDMGDYIAAERAAHTLKGVSGNIGAVEVQEMASRLEEALGGRKGSDEINTMLDELATALDALVERINSALEAETGAPRGIPRPDVRVSEGTMRKTIDRLERCLEASDSEAVDIFYAARDGLASLYGHNSIAGLESSIRSYDFAAALDILRSLHNRTS